MNWENKSVLVTGVEGFLASWTTKFLVEQKANVVGLSRDDIAKSNFDSMGLAKEVTLFRGSLTSYEDMERCLNEYEIETVFHLAAQTIVGTANRAPLSTFESNVHGTYNLLEAARRSPLVKAILVASSDKAYGEHARLPYAEDFALQGRNPYDVSKSCADLIAQAYSHTYGMPVVVTRCGNIYGGGDLNFNRIVPGTIRSLLFNEDPVIRSDGTPLRDYVYVEDIANTCIKLVGMASSAAAAKIRRQAFNLGTGKPLSVREIAEKILKLYGARDRKLDVRGKSVPAGEIAKQYLSSEKAAKAFGWKATTFLDDGLRKTIAWYQNYFKK